VLSEFDAGSEHFRIELRCHDLWGTEVLVFRNDELLRDVTCRESANAAGVKAPRVGCDDALKRRIVIGMLTTPRAIVLAAFLVCLAALAHAAFPRYQVETLRADAGVFTRMDRWRGTIEVGAARSDARPKWITVNAALTPQTAQR